jgi:hypothetical protein
MGNLNTYQQIQFAVLAVFFLLFVVTGGLCLVQVEPSDFVFSTYNKLEAIFLTLLSVKTLSEGIARSNGVTTTKSESTSETTTKEVIP